MRDEELIEMVANLWVGNGGDAEGFTWCWTAIRDAVKAKMEGGEG